MGKSVWLPELGRLTARYPALPSLWKQGDSGVLMPLVFLADGVSFDCLDQRSLQAPAMGWSPPPQV